MIPLAGRFPQPDRDFLYLINIAATLADVGY